MSQIKKYAPIASAVLLSALVGAFAAPIPVSSAPDGKDKDVTVVNPPSQPVPVAGTVKLAADANVVRVGNQVSVLDVTRTAQPFQDYAFKTGVGVASFPSFTVPPGKRLVVEHASIRIHLPAGQECYANLGARFGSNPQQNATHHIPLVTRTPWGSNVNVIGGGPVRLYADEGTTIGFDCYRTSDQGTWNQEASISGYLVDMP